MPVFISKHFDGSISSRYVNTRYWSLTKGEFMTNDGRKISEILPLDDRPKYDGSMREWYETLRETTDDVIRIMSESDGQADSYSVAVGKDAHCLFECSILAHLGKENVTLMFSHFEESASDHLPSFAVNIEGVLNDGTVVSQGQVIICD